MSKDAVINMRAQPSKLEIIDAAAKAVGKSRSAFLREAAEAEARKILATPRLVTAE